MMPSTKTGRSAMNGALEAIPLFDLCQFLLLNRQTGTLVVRNEASTVRIYFESGMIHDITDEMLQSGESLLMNAVRWRSGSFEFLPGPTGAPRNIASSTEAILLETARRIDEERTKAGNATEGPTQEEIFRERQSFAGELAEAFRKVMEPGGRSPRAPDELRDVFEDLQRTRGSLFARGSVGLLRTPLAVRSQTLRLEADEILAKLGVALPRPTGSVDMRLQRGSEWFHLRARRIDGLAQVTLAHLAAKLPDAEDLGLPTVGLDPLLVREGGILLWSGVPQGLRSTSLSAWLGRSFAAAGVTVWRERDPRVAWEAIPGLHRSAGNPADPIDLASILDWLPQTLVLDPVQTLDSARLALEAAEAGIMTVVVSTGLTPDESVCGFLRRLQDAGVGDAPKRFGDLFHAWIGVLPLRENDAEHPLVATEIVLGDRSAVDAAGRMNARREETPWRGGERRIHSYREEINRLERDGRVDPDLRLRLQKNLPGLGL